VVTATVQAGVGASGAAGSPGASGSSGVVTVSAPLTNSGTGSAAALALSLGSGLDVSAGSLVVSAVPLSSLAQGGATAGQVVRWNGTAWAVGNVTAGSTAWDDILGKPTFATVATTGSYADLTGKPTLGTLASQDGTFSGTSSGTNTGDQTITLTGDVTGSGTGSFAATLSSTGVSAGTYTSVTVDAKGRVTAGSSPEVGGSSSASDLTSGTLSQARLDFVPLHPFLLMGG
jgi:phage-related tail fiber protein